MTTQSQTGLPASESAGLLVTPGPQQRPHEPESPEGEF